MNQYRDQLGNTIELSSTPRRIISLVPSQTELLSDLDLDDEVTGITKFCVHPESWFRYKTRIGWSRNINIEKIKSLGPDLVIANREENLKEQVAALQQFAPVWVSDINNLDDALSMIRSVGEMVGRSAKAEALARTIELNFKDLEVISRQRTTAYLIWKDPYMTVGGDTFISDMMQRAGFTNVFAHTKRYPETTIEELQRLECEVLLLSSEPYPFAQRHIDEIRSLLPGKKIVLADGEMFSWYGSRLQYAPAYLLQLARILDE